MRRRQVGLRTIVLKVEVLVISAESVNAKRPLFGLITERGVVLKLIVHKKGCRNFLDSLIERYVSVFYLWGYSCSQT
jgi:hypothetical protein